MSRARRDTWQLVTDLRACGVTVVLTTHAMDEAERLADRVVIVNNGTLVATGTPAELTSTGAQSLLSFRARAGIDLSGLLAVVPAGITVQEVAPGEYVPARHRRSPAPGGDHCLVRRTWRARRGPQGAAALARRRLRRAHYRPRRQPGGEVTTTAAPAPLYTPAPGAAPVWRMLLAQTLIEIKLTLRRNGEQLLLTIVIPVVVLILFARALTSRHPEAAVDFLVPGVLALAVMSTAFTGQAIATGFERRYGVLRRLGTTPMPRSVLLLAKTTAVSRLSRSPRSRSSSSSASHWVGRRTDPRGHRAAAVGTAAFSGLGLLLAGVLSAEATLAAANLIYLLLLVLGGVVFPLTTSPAGASQGFEKILPIGR